MKMPLTVWVAIANEHDKCDVYNLRLTCVGRYRLGRYLYAYNAQVPLTL